MKEDEDIEEPEKESTAQRFGVERIVSPLRWVWFGKHRYAESGDLFYSAFESMPGTTRNEAMKYLRQYNDKGSRLVGCRKRLISNTHFQSLCQNINGRGAIPELDMKRHYFENVRAKHQMDL